MPNDRHETAIHNLRRTVGAQAALRRVPVKVRVALAAGGRIEQRRVYPCAPKLEVRDADGKHVDVQLPMRALLDLVEQRVVSGRVLDDVGDAIDFTVTDAGRAQLAPWAPRRRGAHGRSRGD